jgi:hypothetical protein
MSATLVRRPGAASAAPGTAARAPAVVALGAEILIHVKLAPDHLHEVPYVGVGFVAASALLAAVLVALLLRPTVIAWLVGAAVCLGMATAFALSRTVGLPDLHEAWTSDGGLGLAALSFEAIFVVCSLPAARRALQRV